ncbi:MAG: hypothetical protein ABGZ53_17365 [Fuerstiella sp.]
MPKPLIFFFALAILGVTTFVWASESDEIREKAKEMQREAAELAEQGHKEEAEHLQHDCPDEQPRDASDHRVD